MAVHCSSVDDCPAVDRICVVLQFYERIRFTDHGQELLTRYFADNPSSQTLLDDYSHIVHQHFDGNRQHSNAAFHSIYTKLNDAISCNIEQCDKFARHNRDRRQFPCNDQSHTELDVWYYFDVLDTIHCALLHSYDVGFRINHDEIFKLTCHYDRNLSVATSIDADRPLSDDEYSHDAQLSHDCNMDLISAVTQSKRQFIQQLSGSHRIHDQCNKYNTVFSVPSTNASIDHSNNDRSNTVLNELFLFLSQCKVDVGDICAISSFLDDNEYDSDALTLDLASASSTSDLRGNDSNICRFVDTQLHNQSLSHQLRQFCEQHVHAVQQDRDDEAHTQRIFKFGYRLYYWPWYESNEDEDFVHNAGHRYCELYVSPKYDTFKHEILQHGDAALYAVVHKKGKQFAKCEQIRRTKSKACNDRFHFGIRFHSALTLQHLISVVLYTDFSSLSYQFSSSFRRLHKQDSLEHIKRRNREYCWWSKLLRETVECFGEDSKNSKIHRFYHGTSRLYFSQFNASFYGPTSTSALLEVATIFSDQDRGVILELQSYDDYDLEGALYFNCSFLSCFSSEDEKLFFGGFRKLKFYSVRVLCAEKWENFRYFIAALCKYDNIMKGQRLWNNDSFSKQQIKIISKLVNHKLAIKNNHFHEYINHTFHAFCSEKNVITLDLRFINRFYKYFATQFVSSKCKTLLECAHIAKLYHNCHTIVTVNQEGHYAISITAQHLLNLLMTLDELNQTNLQCIKVINAKFHRECVSKIRRKFNEKQWFINPFTKEKYCDLEVNVLYITKSAQNTDFDQDSTYKLVDAETWL